MSPSSAALLTLTLMLVVPGSAWPAAPGSGFDPQPPLLPWSLLRETHYTPRGTVEWPEGLAERDGTRVRVEGYLMPNFGAQEPGDLLVTRSHPQSLFCGPTDMTALIEVHFSGFTYGTWPLLPVEVTGTFSLSKNPNNLFSLYRLRADSWRELRRWEQEFPGVVEDQLDDQDPQ